MNDLAKKTIPLIIATVVGGVLVAIIMFGVRIIRHIDKATPVTTIENNHNKLCLEVEDNKKLSNGFQKDLSIAIKILKDIANQPVKGKATRDIKGKPIGENRVYINAFSDARNFKYGEEVILEGPNKEIRAIIKGHIRDKREDVIIKMNIDAADEFGLSAKKGIMGNVRMRRVSNEKLGFNTEDYNL